MPDSWDMRWLLAAVVALIIAGVFAVFVPRANQVNATEGLTFLIVRWGHSLVWVLLALSFLIRAFDLKPLLPLANPLAMLGGLTYLLFIGTFTRL